MLDMKVILWIGICQHMHIWAKNIKRSMKQFGHHKCRHSWSPHNWNSNTIPPMNSHNCYSSTPAAQSPPKNHPLRRPARRSRSSPLPSWPPARRPPVYLWRRWRRDAARAGLRRGSWAEPCGLSSSTQRRRMPLLPSPAPGMSRAIFGSSFWVLGFRRPISPNAAFARRGRRGGACRLFASRRRWWCWWWCDDHCCMVEVAPLHSNCCGGISAWS